MSATQESATTWPAADFVNTAQRLRYELEVAIRRENELAQRIDNIQNAAFAKALPVTLVAGGKDELKKLSDERNAAILGVNQKREALRQYLNVERAKFFAVKERAFEHLRTGVSERFARAQAAATELCAALSDLLGTEAECARQERLIREWNRTTKKFNRSIPSVNINGIPSVAGIGPGESLRSHIEGMLIQDSSIRELCRNILSREAQRREQAVALEEARIDQAEAIANPASLVEPF